MDQTGQTERLTNYFINRAIMILREGWKVNAIFTVFFHKTFREKVTIENTI